MNPRAKAAVGDCYAPEQGPGTTGVILASGRVQGEQFFLHCPPRLVSFAEALDLGYRGRVSAFVSFSMQSGLHIHRDSAPASDGPPAMPRAVERFDPKQIARAAAESAAARVSAEGRLRLDPLTALMEIHEFLRNNTRVLVFIDGVGTWEPVSDHRPDVLAALQSWVELCRERRSLVVFSGHCISQRLRNLYGTRPGVRTATVGEPSEAEILDWMVTSEFGTAPVAYDPGSSLLVAAYLRRTAALPGNGLSTIRHLADAPHFLDRDWLKSRGAVALDPRDVDVDGLGQWLSANLVGQDRACLQVVNMAKRLRAGLPHPPHRPLWSAIFAGPAGVGKTELARCTSRFLYGTERLCLISCTEYQQEHELAKLLGAPPGYVGYGEPTLLQQFLGRHQAGVIVFDEVEKAHSNVHKALMGILEEASITTPAGDVLRFESCVVVGTTNAGAAQIQQLLARQPDASREQIERIYEAVLVEQFSAPVIRRFDRSIPFDFLQPDALAAVARIQVRRYLEETKAGGLACEIRWGENLIARIVASSDPLLGGGQIRNVTRQLVGDLLLEQLSENRDRKLIDLDQCC